MKFKKGDKIIYRTVNTDSNEAFRGARGIILQVDPTDTRVPYQVLFGTNKCWWCKDEVLGLI